MNKELRLSFVKPRHVVKTTYPCPWLLNEAREDLALVHPDQSHERYEPLPLINFDDNESQPIHNDGEDMVIHSVTPASVGGTNLWANHQDFEDVAALLHDMKLATSGHGTTDLQIVTFDEKDDVEGEGKTDLIRIRRETTFMMQDGVEERTCRQYDLTFNEFDNIECQEQWVQDLDDVMNGRSDYAVRAIEKVLEERGTEDLPAIPWLPRRGIAYSTILDKISEPVKQGEPMTNGPCVSCAEDFDDNDRRPLAFKCDSRHILCKACILRWFESQGPQNACCPHCRTTIIQETEVLEFLKYGTTGKAYETDERYNKWENFERSCADLDLQHASLSHEVQKLDSRLVLHAWAILIRGARLEPSESTPQHMQPVQSPDWLHIEKAVRQSIGILDGVELPTFHIMALLMWETYRILSRALMSSDLVKVLSEERVVRLIKAPSAENIGLMPGTHSFLRKSISRMLQWARIRSCECADTKFHSHGIRGYYNPSKMTDSQV
ncbi:hypothetical protein KC315_g678 [Hortaea werneckii]|nr:hypothetical protein KC315_g678 [Hortaea werneckii]KAI7371486.1 hypothetical protein KC354_g527 [Hortaea werneckii]